VIERKGIQEMQTRLLLVTLALTALASLAYAETMDPNSGGAPGSAPQGQIIHPTPFAVRPGTGDMPNQPNSGEPTFSSDPDSLGVPLPNGPRATSGDAT
jgi:hypothetical protein